MSLANDSQTDLSASRSLQEQFDAHLQDLSYAFGQPQAVARMRQHTSDFKVWEQLSFVPNGSGEHVFLQVEKTGLNTEAVVQHLAKRLGLKPVNVGYAGLKDKVAVTTQWFSLHLSGKAMPEPEQLNTEQLRVMQMVRNDRKLKIGAIAGNRFEILLTDLQADPQWLRDRAALIRTRGVPNYFGEQRFGHCAQNLHRAWEMLQGKRVKSRHLRGLYYSAMRSFLFNGVLSHRVNTQTWDQALDGEAMMLQGSRSCFVAETIDTDIERRLREFDIHPSGPLPGKGSMAVGTAAELERTLLQPYADLCTSLQNSGLAAQRRALRLPVADLSLDFSQPNGLRLEFSLPSGSYATAVLRELVRVPSFFD